MQKAATHQACGKRKIFFGAMAGVGKTYAMLEAAMSVQHLETLNDVVAQITGVIVREMIPDAIWNRLMRWNSSICRSMTCCNDCARGRCMCRNRPSATLVVFQTWILMEITPCRSHP